MQTKHGIHFDEFHKLITARDIWRGFFDEYLEDEKCSARYVVSGTRIDQTEEKVDKNDYWLIAKANMFQISRIKNIPSKGEQEPEDGWVFDGVLWINQSITSPGNYGIGGRVLCWRPKQVYGLRALLGEGLSNGINYERLVAIRKGYQDLFAQMQREN